MLDADAPPVPLRYFGKSSEIMTSAPVPDPDQSLHLQQDLDAAHQARDRAQIQAEKWRQRYELEAQQRRQEAEAAEQTMQTLRLELQQRCQLNPRDVPPPVLKPAVAAAEAEERLLSLAQLRNQLATITAERNQLSQALAAEKEHHAKTRENLISALSDALKSKPQLPSSPMGARAGSVISKDRENQPARRPRT